MCKVSDLSYLLFLIYTEQQEAAELGKSTLCDISVVSDVIFTIFIHETLLACMYVTSKQQQMPQAIHNKGRYSAV